MILFDLFDTLVDLFIEKLPAVEVDGRRASSTYPALHARIAERVDLDFESFARELAAVDRKVRARLQNEGREYPTIERFRELLRRLAIDDEALAETLTQTHMGKLREMAGFVPHHVEVVRELAERFRLGICSNFSHAPTAERILEESGLRPHLHTIVISERVGFRKPRPEIFRAALEELEASTAETLHVGDNLEADIAGAAALGIPTVWLTRRVADPAAALERYAGPGPEQVIADLAELPALLR